MEKTITVDGREVRLRASAAIPRMYRLKFRRDILQDMQLIQREMERVKREQAESSDNIAPLPLKALTLFENVAYLMARHADPENIPSTVEEWMDGFETFSIYQIFPVIQELWSENLRTISKPAKK